MTEAAQSEKLYTMNQAIFATFLGGPLGGALLLAYNYEQWQVLNYARRAILWGLIATIALFPIAVLLPERTSSVALPVGYTIAFRFIAERVQGAQIKARIEAGAERYSWWRAVGISLVALLGTALVFVIGALMLGLLSAA